MSFPPAIFITGTDTNVGKSVISALLTRGLNAAYWKPVQSGTHPQTDTQWVKSVTALPEHHFLPERYCLSQPLSPHLAAEIDNIEISLSDFSLPKLPGLNHLVIEGAGGLMVPLNSRHLMIDLIHQLQVPVILVSRSTLGTINHTLLSLAQLRQADIPLLGVIMNGPLNAANRASIEHWGKMKVLAEIEPLSEISSESLQACFNQHFQENYELQKCR